MTVAASEQLATAPEIKPVEDPQREILNWIIQGNSRADIVEAVRTRWPDAKAKPLIVAAIHELAAAGNPDMRMVIGFAIEATRSIYQRALAAGQHDVALKAIQQLVKLGK